jgi:hypothetical protein
MNKILKLSVASALALGYATAHAQIAQPASGSSDLILFAEIINSSGGVVASYAGDTGLSINNVLPTSQLAASGSTLNTTTGFTNISLGTVNVPADANMTSFLALDGTGDSVEWAVQAGQFSGTNASTYETTGATKFITTASSIATLTGKNIGNLQHWGSIDGTVTTINSNIAAQVGNPSTKSVFGTSTAGAGVWDSTGIGASVGNWFSNGPVTFPGVTTDELNTFQSLYGVTGNGGSTVAKLQVYSLGSLELTSNGTLETAPSTVPVPAALWLFGSGLLGLLGVGRRKAAQV